MNGSQHYEAADVTLMTLRATVLSNEVSALLISVAQVHATLALAAATVAPHRAGYIGDSAYGGAT